jgi:hypothetical protein
MNALPYGWDGVLIEVDDPAAWFQALMQARASGELDCEEIVPAAGLDATSVLAGAVPLQATLKQGVSKFGAGMRGYVIETIHEGTDWCVRNFDPAQDEEDERYLDKDEALHAAGGMVLDFNSKRPFGTFPARLLDFTEET